MPATEETECKAKHVRLDLDSETHRLLGLVAENDGRSMSSYVRFHLKKHLKDEALRLGFTAQP